MRSTPRVATLAAAPLFALSVAVEPAAADDGEDATVSVLHGVPGLTVDVYANGSELISDFTPGTLTDPRQLPAGTYDLHVYPAGSDPAAAQPAISADGVEVPAGADITVVAHLDANGTPVLTPFVNEPAALEPGQAELTVRHVAAAPAVDVRAGGHPVLTGLTNPNGAGTPVPAGTVSADVVLAGTDQVVIGPADLTLAEGTQTIVYAWGSAADANLALTPQVLAGGAGHPTGASSGGGGCAAAA
ncbi:DUF4397 domain-containing protein [Kineococcus sp. SYSU DK003]|uniref:DUF4397 domain-containing protein n=1 Tax=Kineococcus sp. SYSU DK003 TaxID=3383124 RepID=UPI003D7D058D